MVARNQSRVRMLILVTVHLTVGAMLPLILVIVKNVTWGFFGFVVYQTFVISELLLLGLWAGFSNIPLWKRLCSLLAGISWVTGISLVSSYNMDTVRRVFVANMEVNLITCILGVVVPSAVYQRTTGRIKWQCEWPSRLKRWKARFTLKSLFVVISVSASSLSWAVYVRQPEAMSLVGEGITSAIGSLLLAWMSVWAALGLGDVKVRVPVAVVCSPLVGLLLLWFWGYSWPSLVLWAYWLMWILTAMSVSIVSLTSLLVIRSCGYRLVRVHSGNTTEQGMVDGALRDGHSGTTIANP